MTASPASPPGTVYLVGAGPGDPRLLTLRAVECLQQADLVLHDYLASPALIEHVPDRAELVHLGHHTGGRSLTPDQITERMVQAALEGRTVVRLKGGDASVFARGADEASALRAAGIPFEIVPGITSGLAVGAYAEIPLTHHEDASAVALVTARERDTKAEAHLDWAALAAFPGTLVLYMGVKQAPAWTEALLKHGKPADTPVAIVQWCTRARQQMARCTLGTVVDVVRERGFRPPSLFVVGPVVDRAPPVPWFQARPLFGTTVLVAGSARTAGRLRERLAAQGAEVIVQPAIRVTDPPDQGLVDATLERLAGFDWLVFSSPNGVDRLMSRVFASGGDVRRLAGVRLAALGAATGERLEDYHLRAELVPDRFEAGAMARALVDEHGGRTFLLARADDDQSALAAELEAAGGRVEQITVYATVDVETPDEAVAQALTDGEIHWAAVTSVPTARSLVRLYGPGLTSVQIASLSPMTTQALADLGHPPAVEATPATVTGLVEAIAACEAERRRPIFQTGGCPVEPVFEDPRTEGSA
jgi:uroporphyrinogen III methyltransferase/synthase